MFKRLISCLIIISMLWGDIAAAMNDEEVKPPSLSIKRTNSSSKNSAAEESPIFNGDSHGLFRTITPTTDKAAVEEETSGKIDHSQAFHSTIPEHVEERVLALRDLDASLDSFSDEALDDLYDLLKHSLLTQNTKIKGEIENKAKVEGLFTYVTLTQYAEKRLHFNEEASPEEGSHTTRKAARILAALNLPTEFSLVAVSLFGLFSAFMGWKGALALSITAAALGFVPEAFLQSHNVQETLDDIGAKESGPKRGWKESVKDPYWWGAGAAKVVGMIWAFCQNALTNLAPIFVSLVMLIPAYLGGSDETQKAITGIMITLAIPYLISEILSGTHDMWGHAVSMVGTVRDFCYGVYDRIVKWCTQKDPLSPSQKKREIRRIIKGAISEALRFTPEHVEDLNKFKRQLKGEEAF